MAVTLRDALINWAGGRDIAAETEATRFADCRYRCDDECCGGSPYDTREEERGR